MSIINIAGSSYGIWAVLVFSDASHLGLQLHPPNLQRQQYYRRVWVVTTMLFKDATVLRPYGLKNHGNNEIAIRANPDIRDDSFLFIVQVFPLVMDPSRVEQRKPVAPAGA
jgi:hypothetical protein